MKLRFNTSFLLLACGVALLPIAGVAAVAIIGAKALSYALSPQFFIALALAFAAHFLAWVGFMLWLGEFAYPVSREEEDHKKKIASWTSRHRDATFGEPIPPGAQDIETFVGLINVRPPDQSPYPIRYLRVYLDRTGFTDGQRQLFESIRRAPNELWNAHLDEILAHYVKEMSLSGVPPRTAAIEKIEIGRDSGTRPIPWSVDYEYDQDEYVTLTMRGDRLI